MTLRKSSHRLALWSSVVLATLAGCHKNSPVEPVSIFVGGQCIVATTTIVCRDASRSEPPSSLTIVDWELTSGTTGLSLAALSGAPGGEISFTGLTNGNYQVNQTVSARDGSIQQRTYGPFTVGSSQ